MDRQTPHMLIVEDNSAMQRLLAEFLQLKTYTFDIAEDGVQAFQQTLIRSYDLIFMDLQLPRMDGIDTIKAIRINLPFVPIIVITGVNDMRMIQRARDSGADAYLPKPFAVIDLERLLQRLLPSAAPGKKQ